VSTTERVIEILTQEGGYRQLPTPFKVGATAFEFTYALVAGARANDLVVVVELKGDTADEALTRKVMALTRALDVMRSKRPVTAVLTSGQPRSETVRSIGKVCRVLPIGAPTGPDAVADVRGWLSVLLPLTEPPAVDAHLDWEAQLHAATATAAKGEMADALVKAAAIGREAVEEILATKISSSVNAAFGEGD
jgi:hypothetical protein